jgi:hypothetical protein
MPSSLRWILATILLAGSCRADAQQKSVEPKFVINPDREYLYIQFDHFGPGEPRNDGEATNRVWLRLVNNCTVTIQVIVNGFEPGHKPADEIALQDLVVADPPPRMVIEQNGSTSNVKSKIEAPSDYWMDVGSEYHIRPGKNILFSLPTSQFVKHWHIEIPYEFVVPQGKGPRPEEIGGLPEMHLTYSLWWLPTEIQRKIENENTNHQ